VHGNVMLHAREQVLHVALSVFSTRGSTLGRCGGKDAIRSVEQYHGASKRNFLAPCSATVVDTQNCKYLFDFFSNL
jgi:hypothetical protein